MEHIQQIQQGLLIYNHYSTARQAAGIYRRRLRQHIWKDAHNLTHLDQQKQKQPEKPPKKLITLTLYMESKDRQTSTG